MKNQYLKKVKPKHKYREFLKVLNGLLQLSDRERDILALLIEIDDNWPESFQEKNITSTDSRRHIMSSTQINKNNLSKYISLFKEKGILYDTGNGWSVSNMFKPIVNDNRILVSFILDLKEDEIV